MTAVQHALRFTSDRRAGGSSVLPPFPDQREALDCIHEAFGRGVRRQVIQEPTGSGKTVISMHLIGELGWPCNVFIAHRDELVNQTVAKLRQTNPNLTIGIVKADRDELGADVVVASAQTLANAKRLDRLVGTLASPRLLVIDEAHHAVAGTWLRAIDAIDATLTLGLTATAYRADKLALSTVFDEIVHHTPMLVLIAQGRLANPIGIRIDTETDLSSVHAKNGDFVESELGAAVDNPTRNQLVVDSWRLHGAEAGYKRPVAFCVNREHAEHLRDAFRANGISAEMVLGNTPTDERRRIYKAFHDGLLGVITSVGVLTEGWDEPSADCALMARPTGSLSLWVQMVGRIMRTYPGKPNVLVMDFVDDSDRNQLVTLPTLAGLEAKIAADPDGKATLAGRDDEDLELDLRKVGEQASLIDMAKLIAKAQHIRAVEVNLFGASPYVWGTKDELWWTSSGDGSYLALWPEDEGYVPLRITRPQGPAVWTQPPTLERLFDRPVEIATARNLAEALVPQNPLTTREAGWRARPASQKQLDLATRMHLQVPPDVTAGDLSAAIDRAFFSRTLSKLGLKPPKVK